MRLESSEERGGSTDSPAPSCACPGPASNTCGSRLQVSTALHTTHVPCICIYLHHALRQGRGVSSSAWQLLISIEGQDAARMPASLLPASNSTAWRWLRKHRQPKKKSSWEQHSSKSGCQWSTCHPVQQWAGACLCHELGRDVAAQPHDKDTAAVHQVRAVRLHCRRGQRRRSRPHNSAPARPSFSITQCW